MVSVYRWQSHLTMVPIITTGVGVHIYERHFLSRSREIFSVDLVNTLNNNGVKATFFVNGLNCESGFYFIQCILWKVGVDC